TGLAGYPSLKHHHNVRTMQHSRSFMDQHKSALHSSNWRMGRLLAREGPPIFQIETTLNNDTFPKPFDFLQRREWEWSARDGPAYLAAASGLSRMPRRAARAIFSRIEAPHAMTSVHAGEVEAVHALTTEPALAQQLVA